MTLSPLVVFATVSGAVALVMALTGCVWLLTLGRCSDLYTCSDTEVVSQPPRNDPLSAALATPVRFEDVARQLTAFVRSGLASDNRSSAEPSCDSAPSVGCRYTIVLKFVKRPNTCLERIYLVAAGVGDGPVVTDSPGQPVNCRPL